MRSVGSRRVFALLAAFVVLGLSRATLGEASGVTYGVRIAPTGPTPSTQSVPAGTPIYFSKSVPEGESRILFDSASCSLETADVTLDRCAFSLPPGGYTDIPNFTQPFAVDVRIWTIGTFTYRVEGFGAGVGAVEVHPSGLIDSRRGAVTFGDGVGLMGLFANSNTLPGAPSRVRIGVTVLARPFAADAFEAVAATLTADDGRWHARVHPIIETTYRLHYVQNEGVADRSEDIVVRVRPRVTVRATDRHTLVARVKALSSYAGKVASLQRFTRRRWATVAVAPLDENSRTTFHLRGLPGGSLVRVVVPRSEAQPGYIAGLSQPLRLAR